MEEEERRSLVRPPIEQIDERRGEMEARNRTKKKKSLIEPEIVDLVSDLQTHKKN
ncbi:hypothetical protein U1Q18_023022, partial [Sarracenia purpurea var. burkii]